VAQLLLNKKRKKEKSDQTAGKPRWTHVPLLILYFPFRSPQKPINPIIFPLILLYFFCWNNVYMLTRKENFEELSREQVGNLHIRTQSHTRKKSKLVDKRKFLCHSHSSYYNY